LQNAAQGTRDVQGRLTLKGKAKVGSMSGEIFRQRKIKAAIGPHDRGASEEHSYLSKPALVSSILGQSLPQHLHKSICELRPARDVKVLAKNTMPETVLGNIVIYDIDAATSVLVNNETRSVCISTLRKPPCLLVGGK
jgi:hypothetical protein